MNVWMICGNMGDLVKPENATEHESLEAAKLAAHDVCIIFAGKPINLEYVPPVLAVGKEGIWIDLDSSVIRSRDLMNMVWRTLDERVKVEKRA